MHGLRTSVTWGYSTCCTKCSIFWTSFKVLLHFVPEIHPSAGIRIIHFFGSKVSQSYLNNTNWGFNSDQNQDCILWSNPNSESFFSSSFVPIFKIWSNLMAKSNQILNSWPLYLMFVYGPKRKKKSAQKYRQKWKTWESCPGSDFWVKMYPVFSVVKQNTSTKTHTHNVKIHWSFMTLIKTNQAKYILTYWYC